MSQHILNSVSVLPLQSGMDTEGRSQDRIIEKHLLGLGVLFVTVSSGYLLSGLSGGREAQAVAQEARAEEAGAEADGGPAEAEPEVETTIDEHIKEVAARHGLGADRVDEGHEANI